MEGNGLFKTVLLKHPPVRNIFIDFSFNLLHIFGYAHTNIWISKFNCQNNIISDARHDFDGEMLQHDHEVINIFLANGKYYGVDQLGYLFNIHRESTGDVNADAEYDLFEDSPERPEKWAIGGIQKLVDETSVLNTCLSSDGLLALLRSSDSQVYLELINILSGEKVKSIVVKEPGVLQIQNKNNCMLEWIPQDKIIHSFYSNWFKEGREKSGFFVVTLPEGSILAVFPESGDVEYMNIWYSHFVASHWDFTPDPECEETGICGLTLVSADGAVVRLSEMGEMATSYLPAGSLKTACIAASHPLLYFSDWRDSYRMALPPSSSPEPCVILPLKGILCLTDFGSYTIAHSRSGEIYIVDNSYKIKDDVEQILPDSSITAELIRKNAALEEINAQIAATDKYIAAILQSKKTIEFSLTAQMLSVRRSEHTFCLVMKCLSEGVSLARKDWLLALSVSTVGAGSVTSTHTLREELQAASPHIQVFSISLSRYPVSQLTLRVSLLFAHIPPNSSFVPRINVGKVEMDPSYFLLPPVELETEFVPQEQDLASTIKSIQGCGDNAVTPDHKENIKLSIKLSKNYPEESVFQNLLNNSKALWRTSWWDKACMEKKLEIAVINKLVTLEVADGTVTISGSDSYSCYIAKEALYSSAPAGCFIKGNPFLLLEQLETYAATGEVLAHMNDPPKEKLEELRRLLRENITSNFTP